MVNLLILFIKYLYDHNKRVDQIKVILSNIKCEMLLTGLSTECFNDPRYVQAIKSSKYTLNEIKIGVEHKLYNDQLPISFDMIQTIKHLYWTNYHTNMDSITKYNCGIFLCIELMFDTGRRISSFIFQGSKNQNDHSLKNKHVIFHFKSSPDYPFVEKVKGGQQFHDYVIKNNIPESLLIKVQLNFITEKTTSKFKVNPIKPVYIHKTNDEASGLVSRIFYWSKMNNNNCDNDVFFTRVSLLNKKKLLRKDITRAIRTMVINLNLNSSRFGPHSIRRGYLTMVKYYCEHNTIPDDYFLQRAGWSINSNVPNNAYSKMESFGGYSLNNLLFTLQHVRDLIQP